MHTFIYSCLLPLAALGVLVTACTDADATILPATSSPTQPSTATASIRKTPIALAPSATPTEIAGISQLDVPLTATSVATYTPRICSPLAEHPLAELPEIISDPYHPPPLGKDDRHQGVDFAYYRRGERQSILGAVVQSVFAGRVAAAIVDSFPYGNLVMVETSLSELPVVLVDELGLTSGESMYSLYAHLESMPELGLGERVAACQPLGTVGKSGNAGVPHLHLEMRIGPADQSFSAMAFYTVQASQTARENYLLWRTSGVFRHFDPMLVLRP